MNGWCVIGSGIEKKEVGLGWFRFFLFFCLVIIIVFCLLNWMFEIGKEKFKILNLYLFLMCVKLIILYYM